jgi:hypothetical protein
MLILPQEVEVTLNGYNINYYENKGYSIERKLNNRNKYTVPHGTKLLIDVLDLQENSDIKVQVKCDYCGEIVYKQFKAYTKNIKTGIIKKDCCKECRNKKIKESNLIIYKVENVTQLDEYKLKFRKDRQLSDDYIREQFLLKEHIIINMNYENNTSPIDFICLKHIDKGIQTNTYLKLQQYGYACNYCGLEKRSGENHYEWKGGISPLYEYLRSKINSWKNDSFIFYNYKCALSNSNKNLIIHHLYPFSEILKEVLLELKLPICKEINNYTKEQLLNIELKCLELHYKYGLGICLTKDIHNLFHKIYGNKYFTSDNFWEFKQRWNNNEFNNIKEGDISA